MDGETRPAGCPTFLLEPGEINARVFQAGTGTELHLKEIAQAIWCDSSQRIGLRQPDRERGGGLWPAGDGCFERMVGGDGTAELASLPTVHVGLIRDLPSVLGQSGMEA